MSKKERDTFRRAVIEPNVELEEPIESDVHRGSQDNHVNRGHRDDRVNWHSLFLFLDRKLTHGDDCDNTLRLTEQFCTRRRIDFGYVEEVLFENGGFCDCEVLMNAAEHLDDDPPPGIFQKIIDDYELYPKLRAAWCKEVERLEKSGTKVPKCFIMFHLDKRHNCEKCGVASECHAIKKKFDRALGKNAGYMR